MIKVTVAYATAQLQSEIELTVVEGCTVAAAISQSGILQRHPEIDLTSMPVGIYAKPVALTDILGAGDRVEIYRPLQIDPKQARLLRAKRQQHKKNAKP